MLKCITFLHSLSRLLLIDLFIYTEKARTVGDTIILMMKCASQYRFEFCRQTFLSGQFLSCLFMSKIQE